MSQKVYKTDPKAFCAYTDAGMTLFPCVGYTKIPAEKGFLERSFDPDFIPEDHNYGVLLRQRYLVIDADPRAYQGTDKPLTRLFKDLQLPEELYRNTFTVKTPRGGYHVYFTKPSDILCVNSLKEYPGLEFKTQFIMACGAYIVKTEKGEPVEAAYKAVFKAPEHIIKAPQILLARLLRPAPPTLDPNVKIKPDNAADIKAFIQHCQTVEPAQEGKAGDLRTFQVACRGREYGLAQATTFGIMADHFNPRCVPPWEPSALKAKVENAYVYGTRNPAGVMSVQNAFPETPEVKKDGTVETIKISYQYDSRGNIKKNMSNLTKFFQYPVVYTPQGEEKKRTRQIPAIGNYLRYDQFSHRILWAKPAPWFKHTSEWTDDDAIQFKGILSEQLSMDYSVSEIHEVATICAAQRAFHPVREYLESCKWDGVRRLDHWLSRYCSVLDCEYSRFVGRKVLVAAVARVFAPGCKFDHVLVSEGSQGIGKSYMWEILASPWFTDAPLNIQDKSAIEILQGKWVVELAEMDALTKYESQTIKGFLSRTEDRARMAYARKAQNYPRQNIFVGSINPEETGWLKDRTGNRRYWPVAVTNIDLKGLKHDRDCLWAEALLAFQQGETLHVDDTKMQTLMNEQISTRMQEDPWFGLVEEYLHTHVSEFVVDGNKIVVTPSEVFTQCIGGNASQFRMGEASRIASILKTLGYIKTRLSYRQGYAYVKLYVSQV